MNAEKLLIEIAGLQGAIDGARDKQREVYRDLSGVMREMRKTSEMSGRELARRMGISVPALADMEAGRRNYLAHHAESAMEILSSNRSMSRRETHEKE